jgi:putative flippase GtrA
MLKKLISKFTHKNFIKYFVVGVLSVVMSTAMLIVMVDWMGVWVGTANIIQTFIVFIVKYVLYDKAGMLSGTTKKD